MNPASSALIQIVHEDLLYLVSQWPTGKIADDEIRRSSAVLRRLFNHRDLLQVWCTIVGPKDYIVPSTFLQILDSDRLAEVDFSTSSPAEQGDGITIYEVQVFNKIQKETTPIRKIELKASLKKFLSGTACIINGSPICRDEMVQFVANKLGGTHYDEHRKPREKSLAAMEQYQTGNRPALIHEMLSCGQTLAKSESTIELLRRLEKQ